MPLDSNIRIRDYQIQDLSPLVRLFTESVHELTATAYDETQRYAWASRTPHLDTWQHRLESLTTLVAEERDQLAGFNSNELNRQIDLIYTAPNNARKGVASALLRKAEEHLQSLGVEKLSTEASAVARPFFQRHGFEVEQEHRTTIRGVPFLRYIMHKSL